MSEKLTRLINSTKMSRKYFGQYFDIPEEVLFNWEHNDPPCPDYIFNLIEYRAKNEHLIKKIVINEDGIRQNRIIFLDYDGVVNNYLWCNYQLTERADAGFNVRYAFPEDGFVNNFQAISWLNKLYDVYPYDIVVTSTWKEFENYKECLYNGGLNPKIKIIDKLFGMGNYKRDTNIHVWLIQHDFSGDYLIIDDEDYLYRPDKYRFEKLNHLIITNEEFGFGASNYEEAIQKFKLQENQRNYMDHK